MHKLAVCPNYVQKSDARDIVDVLMRLLHSDNPCKLVVDKNLEIIDRYRRFADSDGLVSSWLKLMIELERRNIHRVDIGAVLPTASNQDLTSDLAKTISSHRRMLVDDVADYAALTKKLTAYSIKVFKRSDGGKVFDFPEPFDYEGLTHKILARCHQMVERKYTHSLEDLHNDIIVDCLRGDGYSIADQSRSGRSGAGGGAGELDMVVRSAEGCIESIVEALRLNSCGKTNRSAAEHLSKLVDSYDSVGVARNYILVYCEAANFSRLWGNYLDYMSKINSHKSFSKSAYPLKKIDDVSVSYNCKANVRVALAEHERPNLGMEIVHIAVNVK